MRHLRLLPIVAAAALCNTAIAGHHHDHLSVSLGGTRVVLGQNQPVVTTVTETTTTYVNTPSSQHHHSIQWLAMSSGMPLPAGIVVGGSQPNPPATLFVCRTNYNGGMHPGKLINGYCNIGWGGQEISATNYEVLVSTKPLSWATASNGYVPPNAVEGGYQQNGPLYICQAKYMGGKHPGKVVGTNCNIGYGGQEILVPFYKVLVK